MLGPGGESTGTVTYRKLADGFYEAVTEGKSEAGAFTIRETIAYHREQKMAFRHVTDSRGYSYTQMAEVGGNIGGDYRLFFKSAPFTYQGQAGAAQSHDLSGRAADVPDRCRGRGRRGRIRAHEPVEVSTSAVITVAGVRKTYGQTVAVDDVSFEVQDGEIFGLIGPNGAGKTTTMECVEGIRKPDRGTISVLGLDPFRDVYQLQDRIGVQLQQAHLQKRIKVWEAVHLWASLYKKPVSHGERLLEQLGLSEKRNAWFMTLSGGQQQRLFIALALINDPEVVFLDELTTGLDPQARRAIWELVRGIRARGKTVFMTTHLMEEAERLCDRVAIIEHGRIIDVDSPQRLVDKHCPDRSVVLSTEDPPAEERFRALRARRRRDARRPASSRFTAAATASSPR